MVKVTVKWSTSTYGVDVDPEAPVADFKAQLFSLTGVPPERQKLMCKAWKGVLKDDGSLSVLTDGAAVTLMGSAEGVTKPAETATFVEDMPASAIVRAGHMLPPGLANTENVCYANSTLEVFRFVPEVKDALMKYKTKVATLPDAERTPQGGADLSLAALLHRLDSSMKAVDPTPFYTRLRGIYPQFNETDPRGMYKQQDSEEFLNALMTVLASELKWATEAVPTLRPGGADGASAPNVVDTLFGVEYKVQLTCTESAEEPVSTKTEFHRKLVCNIDGGAGRAVQINHLHEGIAHGLTGEVEKSSTLLGRNAVWKRVARLSQLPKYLCVQFMRFYWKATPESHDHAGVKCKMLRPVTFPADGFDVYDLCSEEVKAVLKVERDKVAEVALAGLAKRARLDRAAAGDASTAVGTSASTSAGSTAPVPMEDEDLAAALAMSMEGGGGGASTSAAAPRPIGYCLPPGFRGLYELFGLVTHKGRSADSGHYISWIRKRETEPSAPKNAWLVFDDETVSEVDTEYVINQLKGGGDDHMAYLAFYKAMGEDGAAATGASGGAGVGK